MKTSMHSAQAPDIAPHFSLRMQQHPHLAIIKTYLNTEMQLKAEKILNDYINQLQGLDIHNAAALIIHNATRNVVAYVGSADFYDKYGGGQVDGIRAVRQDAH